LLTFWDDIGPIFKCQEDYLTVEDGTDRSPWNVCN